MSNLKVKVLADTKDLVKGVRRTKDELSGIQGVAKKAGGALKGALGGVGIAVGFAAIASGIIQATKAAAADVKSQKLLATQLKTTTKATAGQIKGAEKFVESLSNQTGILDDDLRPALANAVRGTGSLKKAQDLVKVALDGAAASGKPLDTVLQALIKASNGNTGALYKLAPQLKTTKGGIDDYAASVKGAAEAAADPFAKFNVAIENLTEQFGMLLLPYIEEFITYLTTTVVPAVSGFLDDVSDPNTDTGKVFMVLNETLVGKDGKSGVYGAILGVIDAFGTFFSQISANGNSLDGLVKTIEVLGLSLEYAVIQSQNLIKFLSNPFTIIDIQAQGLNYVTRLNDILNRKSLFSNPPAVGTGQTGTAIRGIEGFAKGGIVLPRSGGTIGRIGEAGQAEAVIPLDRLNEFIGGGTGTVVNINVTRANVSGQDIVQAIQQYERNSGRKIFA